MRCVAIALLGLGACSGTKTDDDELTEEEFEEEFAERFCSEWEDCSTNGSACPVSEDGTTPGTNECDYDPVAAEACLDGTWSCNTDFPGFEFPEVDDACLEVCGPYTPPSSTTTPM